MTIARRTRAAGLTACARAKRAAGLNATEARKTCLVLVQRGQGEGARAVFTARGPDWRVRGVA